jgi:hypothetical protein
MKTFVDSGSDADCISKKAALRVGLQPSRKKTPHALHGETGQVLPQTSVTGHEVHTTLQIQEQNQRMTLDVISLADFDIILGILWLREYNPHINGLPGPSREKTAQATPVLSLRIGSARW